MKTLHLLVGWLALLVLLAGCKRLDGLTGASAADDTASYAAFTRLARVCNACLVAGAFATRVRGSEL